MKVVCIEPFKGKEFDINQQGGIRYGISYDVVSRAPFGGGIKIINDFGKQHTYKRSRFITLKEWRERQLNEIGL
jgi:hypothetical protein